MVRYISVLLTIILSSTNVLYSKQNMSYSQHNAVVEYCLMQNDLDSLLSYFNYDEEKAIMSLCSYEMNPQLNVDAFWFAFSNRESSDVYNYTYKSDTLYSPDYGKFVLFRGESLQLKSIYWLIVLFYGLNYDKENICQFYEHGRLSDIYMTGKVGGKEVNLEIKPNVFGKKVKRWKKTLSRRGLEYLRIKDKFFLTPSEYKIFKYETYEKNFLLQVYKGENLFQNCFPLKR